MCFNLRIVDICVVGLCFFLLGLVWGLFGDDNLRWGFLDFSKVSNFSEKEMNSCVFFMFISLWEFLAF